MSRFMKIFLKLVGGAMAWVAALLAAMAAWGGNAGAIFVFGSLIWAACYVVAKAIVEMDK